jgi:hypothetical protein
MVGTASGISVEAAASVVVGPVVVDPAGAGTCAGGAVQAVMPMPTPNNVALRKNSRLEMVNLLISDLLSVLLYV